MTRPSPTTSSRSRPIRAELALLALIAGCSSVEPVSFGTVASDPAPLHAQLVRITDRGLEPKALQLPAGTGTMVLLNASKDRVVSARMETAHTPLDCVYQQGFVSDGESTFTVVPLAPGTAVSLCFHRRGPATVTVHGATDDPLRLPIVAGERRELEEPGLAERSGVRPAQADGEESPPPPVFDAVEARVSSVRGGEVLSAGDALEVDARGDPGVRVELELRPGERLPLVEHEPGSYRLRYEIVVGDHTQGPPRLHATDAHGQTTTRAIRDPRIQIDARPPGTPRDLIVERGPRKVLLNGGIETVLLSWKPADGTPAVAYRVYGIDERGVPKQVAQVEGTQARVHAGAVRYAVAGLDAHGNLGHLAIGKAPRAR